MAKRAVVIGAGVGGLTSALRLLRNGWSVTVVEKNPLPGGRLGRVQGGGFHFDLGPTILLMPDVFYQLFADLGRNLDDYVELVALEPNYRLHFGDGSFLDSSVNLQRMMQEIERIAPDDLLGFMRYLSDMHERYRIARHQFIEQPMLSPLELVQHPGRLKSLYKLHAVRSMASDIARYVKDERLRIALTFQSLYIGIDPFSAPAVYNIIGYMEVSYSGVWYVRGGYHKIVDALATVLGELGGDLRLSTPAQQVLYERGRATGVRLASGEELTADAVIVNADYPQAVESLLAEGAPQGRRRRRLERMEQSCSAFMMYLGVNRKYPQADVHNVFFASDFRRGADDIFVRRQVPDEPSFYVHVPSRIDASVAPADKEAIYVLAPVPNLTSAVDWKTEKAKLRNRILDKLEAAGFAGLREAIEFESIWTPGQWQSAFALKDGAAFGLMPRLLQSAYWRPSLRSRDVRGLYFVGASTHPGGGVPIVMTGARTVEELMALDFPGALPAVGGGRIHAPVRADRRELWSADPPPSFAP
jgi:phytoene desaturase